MAGADLAIVLVGAGGSTRMGFDKVWAELRDRPLVAWALAAAASARPKQLVLVVAPERVAEAQALCERLGRSIQPASWLVAAGGSRRRDSVVRGLAACSATWVAVHDVARALVPARLFSEGLAAARHTGAAIPVLPVKDTIKQVVDGRVVATPARSELVAVQTPQVFRRELLERALALGDEDVTDEATLVERIGVVTTYPGDEANFKITTPFDFDLARWLAARGSHAAGRPPAWAGAGAPLGADPHPADREASRGGRRC